MNFVIPMAGAGSRFANAGFTLPKPLIPVEGEPMYRWAVSSLDFRRASRLIFVLRRNEFLDDLQKDIEAAYGALKPRVVVVDQLTRGQAETVWYAREHIDFDQPILVHNSDTAFTSRPEAWDFGHDDGVLLTFKSSEPRWSFARVGTDGRVNRVAEKDVISDNASTGTYYFRDARALFRRLAELCAAPPAPGELYLAPLYNDLIRDGARVTIRPVTQNLCFGTPHDLETTGALIKATKLHRGQLIAKDA